MRPHADAKTLARLRQGDLSPRRSARIGAHLARCARCRALNEDLAGVTTLLASVDPPPIPEHLAARIQAALATEAARRVTVPNGQQAAAAAAPGTAGTAAGGTPPPAGGRPRRRERPGPGRPRLPRLGSAVVLRGLAAAAAVVLVAGGVYELTQHSSGSSSSSSSSAGSSAPAPAVHAPAAGGPAGNERSAEAAPALGPVLRYQHAGGQKNIIPVMTGTDYQPGHLSSQVAAQVARYGPHTLPAGPNATTPSATRGPAAAAGPPATFGRASVATLADCVNRIAAGQIVLLVDVARYRGAPATVIVTEASPGGPEQIWVVGPGCSASRSDVMQHTALNTAG